jgi:hypothetical protein
MDQSAIVAVSVFDFLSKFWDVFQVRRFRKQLDSTPADRHRGVDHERLAHRKIVYERAKRRNPRRWSGNTPELGSHRTRYHSTPANCRKLSVINWPLKRGHLDNWVDNLRNRQWPKLTVFLTDGRIPLDNNPAENAIRPFVICRSFCDHCKSLYSKPRLFSGGITQGSELPRFFSGACQSDCLFGFYFY